MRIYCQRHRCRPWFVVSGDISLMPIFVGVRCWDGVKWECSRRKCDFSLSITISSGWSSPLALHIEIYTASRGFPAIARLFLGRPERWVPWCIFFYFATRSPSSLDRSPWNFATWSESGWILNPTPKTRERFPQKIWGPKTCKISVNFGPLQTLIANISGTAEDIQNRKTAPTMAIRPAFNEKSPVNFGPLTAWNYMWVWTH